MKESLESARNIHQILIVASAAILVFGMSVGPNENKYDLAKKELRAFKEIVDSVGAFRTKFIKGEFYKEVAAEKLKKVKSAVRLHTLGGPEIWEHSVSEMTETFEREWDRIDSIRVQILQAASINKLNDTIINDPETMVLGEYPVYIRGQETTEGVPLIGIETVMRNQFRDDGSYLKKFLARKLCDSNDPKSFMPYLKEVCLDIDGSNYSDLQLMLGNLANEYNSKNKNDADVIVLRTCLGIKFC